MNFIQYLQQDMLFIKTRELYQSINAVVIPICLKLNTFYVFISSVGHLR